MKFVTHEITKKLKYKGYPLQATHDKNVSRLIYEPPRENEDWKDCDVFYVPTISEVLDWFRTNHGIHVRVDLWKKGWYFDVISYEYDESCSEYNVATKHQSEDYKSYDEAAIMGAKYVLDNLI